jgi:hypothetical protein
LRIDDAAFVFTITWPMSMFPRLIGLTGIHRPASAMGPAHRGSA